MLALPERKIYDWWLFDQEEPIGTRELRQQLAILLASYHNVHREKGTLAKDPDDFMLQSAEGYEQRQLDRMLGMLGAVARPRPPGYKRKRPRQRTQ